MNSKGYAIALLTAAVVTAANAQVFQPVRHGQSSTERVNSVSVQATGFDYGLGRNLIHPGNGLLADVEFNKDKWGWGFWIATDDQNLINPTPGGPSDLISQTWKELHYTAFFPTKMADTTFGASIGWMTFHYRDVDRNWVDLNVVGSTPLDKRPGEPSKLFLGASLGYASQVSKDLHDAEGGEPFDDDFLTFEESKSQSGPIWSLSLSYELGSNVSVTTSYWKFNPSGPVDITRKSIGLAFKF